jgi:hypothetical protein
MHTSSCIKRTPLLNRFGDGIQVVLQAEWPSEADLAFHTACCAGDSSIWLISELRVRDAHLLRGEIEDILPPEWEVLQRNTSPIVVYYMPCSLVFFSLSKIDRESSPTLLHARISLLLAFKQACVVASIVPAHHQILQAFVLHCNPC